MRELLKWQVFCVVVIAVLYHFFKFVGVSREVSAMVASYTTFVAIFFTYLIPFLDGFSTPEPSIAWFNSKFVAASFVAICTTGLVSFISVVFVIILGKVIYDLSSATEIDCRKYLLTGVLQGCVLALVFWA